MRFLRSAIIPIYEKNGQLLGIAYTADMQRSIIHDAALVYVTFPPWRHDPIPALIDWNCCHGDRNRIGNRKLQVAKVRIENQARYIY